MRQLTAAWWCVASPHLALSCVAKSIGIRSFIAFGHKTNSYSRLLPLGG
jgi:hypothetical protein